jgi:hypothetical protein
VRYQQVAIVEAWADINEDPAKVLPELKRQAWRDRRPGPVNRHRQEAGREVAALWRHAQRERDPSHLGQH